MGIQRDQQKPIVFVHVDDLKLCPAPDEASWSPDVSTAKSLCASTVAFRPGSQVSDATSTPSSGWEDETIRVKEPLENWTDRLFSLDRFFFFRNMDYMDSRFHSIAHLMCYRYAIAIGQRTFATGIRKWSKHLVDFPTPKCVANNKIQQWRVILTDIYSHLCMTDELFKAVLIDTRPRPFTLQCAQPWGYIPIDPDTSELRHTAPRADVISDILIQVHVDAVSNKLTACRWLGPQISRRGTRRAAFSLAERVRERGNVSLHTQGSPFAV